MACLRNDRILAEGDLRIDSYKGGEDGQDQAQVELRIGPYSLVLWEEEWSQLQEATKPGRRKRKKKQATAGAGFPEVMEWGDQEDASDEPVDLNDGDDETEDEDGCEFQERNLL